MSPQIAQTFPATDPVAQPEELPFYEGLAVGELKVPWCVTCDSHVWRPKSHCTTCYSPVSEWRTLAGTGVIYSYSIVHRSDGAFQEIAPYVLAWITLDGGPTMVANVTAADRDDVCVGARVTLVKPEPDDRRRGAVFSVI